jgi:hypothetical protein
MVAPRLRAAAAPGTYWQKDACAEKRLKAAHVRWCVDSVVVGDDGALEFRCSWSLLNLKKRSDQGNRNMFITDQAGRRLDHIATTGAAKTGGTKRSDRYDVITGSFLFPPPHPDASVFTFHDDDRKIAIPDIRLTAGARTSRKDSLAILGAVARANKVEIKTSWSGRGPSRSSYLVLRRTGQRVEGGTRPVPVATFDAFLRALAEAPILSGTYEARIFQTDDYPSLTIVVTTDGGDVKFYSESQGAGHVPWAVATKGRTWVIPSDAPFRAMKMLTPFAGPR